MCFRAIWERIKRWEAPEPKQEAESIIYPLNTWEKTQAFFDEIMEMECDCPKCWLSMNTVDKVLANGPDKHTYLGFKGTTLIDGAQKIVAYHSVVECQVITNIEQCVYCDTTTEFRYDQKEGKVFCLNCEEYIPSRPRKGTFKYRLDFDPNNGFIYKKWHEGMETPISRRNDENPNYEDYLDLI